MLPPPPRNGSARYLAKDDTARRGVAGEVEDVVSRVDVHESSTVRVLNAMNEGLGSLREVDFPAYGVARPSTLVSLSLHSNRVTSLEGFESMTVSVCFECFCFSSSKNRAAAAVAAGAAAGSNAASDAAAAAAAIVRWV